MIVEERTLLLEGIFTDFRDALGKLHSYRDQVWDAGDIINRNGPSLIEDGHVVRVKNQYEITEIKVDMNIPDSEASLSEKDLKDLYFTPAVNWLKSELGDPCSPSAWLLVSPPEIPTQEGQTTFLDRGLQMFSEYDSIHSGTNIYFRVFAAIPVK